VILNLKVFILYNIRGEKD